MSGIGYVSFRFFGLALPLIVLPSALLGVSSAELARQSAF